MICPSNWTKGLSTRAEHSYLLSKKRNLHTIAQGIVMEKTIKNPKIKFNVVKDILKCKELWNRFSPNKTLFDFWEYRFCFYNGYKYEPYFIVGIESEKEIGILPLWHETKEDYYTFFGGTFPENNTFFINDKSKIKDFLKQCPIYTELSYINKSEKEFYPLQENEKRYFIDLKKYNNNIENYIASFDKKHRKNLRYDLRQFQKLNYLFYYNNLGDFETMVKLNKKRFGKESDYNEKEMAVSMKELMNTAHSQGRLNMISLVIEGKIEAIELAVMHDDWYHVLGTGKNIKIENIGKMMIIEHIRCALKNNISKIDFMTTKSGWKKLWHLESDMTYGYSNY